MFIFFLLLDFRMKRKWIQNEINRNDGNDKLIALHSLTWLLCIISLFLSLSLCLVFLFRFFQSFVPSFNFSFHNFFFFLLLRFSFCYLLFSSSLLLLRRSALAERAHFNACFHKLNTAQCLIEMSSRLSEWVCVDATERAQQMHSTEEWSKKCFNLIAFDLFYRKCVQSCVYVCSQHHHTMSSQMHWHRIVFKCPFDIHFQTQFRTQWQS